MNTERLISSINKAVSVIHKKAKKGMGNFLIISSEVSELINSLDILKIRREKILKILKRLNENSTNNRR